MSDRRFFTPCGPFSVSYLAAQTGAVVSSASDSDKMISDVAPLSEALEHHLSFLDNPKYANALANSRAGVVVVSEAMAGNAPNGVTLLVSNEPYKTYAKIAQLFYPIRDTAQTESISPNAIIDPTAQLGKNCVVEAGAVIGANVRLGDGVKISANAVVGAAVEIGEQSTIGACSSLTHCLIGKRVNILPGARIGQEGFGFAIDPVGHVRIPQLGSVIIEDDVEIGANVTIDRGAGPDTVIGRGTMIDNLVQIGHNVVIGPGCILVAQSGVSGSSRLGPAVALGGQAGIAGHLTIGAGAQIAAQSGIMRDVAPKSRMMGYPAVSSRQFFRQIAWLSKKADEE